jgi:hypothetical protein
MARSIGVHAPAMAWVVPPVANAFTRISVEMCAATGRLAVVGLEADGSGSAAPVTAVTEL